MTKRADPSRLRTSCAGVSRSHVRLRNIKFCVCGVGQRRSYRITCMSGYPAKQPLQIDLFCPST